MDKRAATQTTLRVRYAETDAMGVVYHANYLIWFEAGRGDFFRGLGQDYGQWEAEGYMLPVSEAYARYQAPARYGDLVTVHTWLQNLKSRSITLGYEVTREACGTTLVTGWTKHLCIDGEGQVRRFPGKLAAFLG